MRQEPQASGFPASLPKVTGPTTGSPDGAWRPVAFWSRKLKDPETRYSATDIEWLAVVEAVTLIWRHFLEDTPFVVRSDHKALERKLTKSAHDPPILPRQARWIERLMPYPFEFQHVAGEDNIIADALSRNPVGMNAITVIHPMLAGILGRIRVAAEADQAYQAQKEAAARNEATDYLLQEDLLIRDGGMVVVPRDDDLRTLLISEAHDPVYSGHFGFDKTLEKLRRSWHWPGMTVDVRTYVRTCPTCQKTKHSTTKAPGLLQPILARRPWEVVTMDFVGKFEEAEGTGHTMCLAMVDKFTKYVLLHGVPETVSAAQTADIFLKALVAHFGVPSVVISDRGPQFASALWKSVLDQLGARAALATSHHPQTDGQTERAIQTLIRLIRAYAGVQEDSWERKLPLFQFALNDAFCEATGTTPFRLLYSRDPLSPMSFLSSPAGGHVADVPGPEMVDRVREDLGDVHEFVRQNQQLVAARMKERYDQGRKPAALQPGDLVLLSTKSHHLLEGSTKTSATPGGPIRGGKTSGRERVRVGGTPCRGPVNPECPVLVQIRALTLQICRAPGWGPHGPRAQRRGVALGSGGYYRT